MSYLATIFIAFFGIGCAASSANQRVDELSIEFRDLRKSHALTSQRVREIDRLNQTTFLIQDGLEQLSLEVERLQQSIGKINSQLRIVNAALFDVNPGQQVTAQPAPPPRRVAQTKGEAPKVHARAQQPTTNNHGTTLKEETAQNDPRSIYQRAYENMRNSNTDSAVAEFSQILQRFPNSDLADNAHYWLGEIYIELGDFTQSKKHFEAILQDYPAGNKVPDALFKLGSLALDKGDCKTALTWYGKVREQYPWSPVSEKINERAQQCGSTP